MNDYYVYEYIDPRNLEEFYYGQGRGARKDFHLKDRSDSEKTTRIADIRKEGIDPIIRVIAKGLSQSEALLIEKTLLWKLGKWTTNIATGHFADNFRKPNTLHKKLTGFDYEKGFYNYNVGDGTHRNWEDYVEFGFISAGQGIRWRNAICGFNVGDAFAAYLKRRGFVGVGTITSEAMPIRDAKINGQQLLDLPLRCKAMRDNCDDMELSEYVCLVDWKIAEKRESARNRKTPKLYTTTHVRASLDGQPETVKFIETEFGVSISELIS